MVCEGRIRTPTPALRCQEPRRFVRVFGLSKKGSQENRKLVWEGGVRKCHAIANYLRKTESWYGGGVRKCHAMQITS
uniref:Uncharacterized protein n=1 Tax=Anguilla anguilla TaxID=7936 RepID=A0A0E9SE27_ANGAN